jgi:hypothetical protein
MIGLAVINGRFENKRRRGVAIFPGIREISRRRGMEQGNIETFRCERTASAVMARKRAYQAAKSVVQGTPQQGTFIRRQHVESAHLQMETQAFKNKGRFPTRCGNAHGSIPMFGSFRVERFGLDGTRKYYGFLFSIPLFGGIIKTIPAVRKATAFGSISLFRGHGPFLQLLAKIQPVTHP